jgi:hypothetical protein
MLDAWRVVVAVVAPPVLVALLSVVVLRLLVAVIAIVPVIAMVVPLRESGSTGDHADGHQAGDY